MLTTVERVLRLPGMSNQAAIPTAWLNDLVGDADAAVKSYLKRDIELTAYEEFYSGDTCRDIVCRQHPVLLGQTTAVGTTVLPAATLNVASTAGFHPGLGGNPTATPPRLTVQTGTATFTTVTYTGTTATSFTGCQGGSGTVGPGGRVWTPTVFFDPQAYGGQTPNAFADGTLMVLGNQFMVVTDSGEGAPGRKSGRGLLRRVGGAGAGWVGFYPETLYSGKLAAYRRPTFPLGDLNLKVCYAAGFESQLVPRDIQNACTQLVAYMVRNMPSGGPLQSENLGAYSYSVLTRSGTDIPEIGSIQQTLARYRESSWGL